MSDVIETTQQALEITVNEVTSSVVEVVESGTQGPRGEQGIQGPMGLKGDTGDAGLPGRDGVDGLSAYQVALANGYIGTESEWLASLKGADGAAGRDGEDITSINDAVIALDSSWSSQKIVNELADKLDSVDAVNFSLVGHTHNKADVGLGNVDNTSDVNKPISTATQSALNLKADITAIPTAVSQLTNDSGYATTTELNAALGDIDAVLTAIIG